MGVNPNVYHCDMEGSHELEGWRDLQMVLTLLKDWQLKMKSSTGKIVKRFHDVVIRVKAGSHSKITICFLVFLRFMRKQHVSTSRQQALLGVIQHQCKP